MQSDEKIQAHLVSVWRESKKIFSIGGKEGMLILTDKHLMFIHKTESKMKLVEGYYSKTSNKFNQIKKYNDPS